MFVIEIFRRNGSGWGTLEWSATRSEAVEIVRAYRRACPIYKFRIRRRIG